MTIKFEKAQATLAVSFLFFLSIHFGMIILAYYRGAIYPNDVIKLLLQVLSLYSVPLGIILGGIFGKGLTPKTGTPIMAYLLALILAILWNLILVWRSVTFGIADQDSTIDLLSYLDSISSASTFLVAGALSYFFTSEA